jgi:GT2 family glycosyltransferase
MNRLHSVKKTLPSVLAAAVVSPPVEIVILDYGSTDGLGDWVEAHAPKVRCVRYEAKHFHMAHSRNLSIIMSTGLYVVSSNAETSLGERFFAELRKAIALDVDVVRVGKRINGVVCMRRESFMQAGGFDERFEFYGPEDKDLVNRLQRRNLKHGEIDPKLVRNTPTPDPEKVLNYRLPLSKREMRKRMGPVYEENEKAGVMVANKEGWGRW